MNVVVVTTAGIISAEPLGPVPDNVRLRTLTSSVRNERRLETLVVSMSRGSISRLIDRIYVRSQGSVALRMLIRISPLDRGARFWRAVRRHDGVHDFIADADLLVSGDRDANFACWQLARRANITAVSGYAAGTRELSRRFR